MNSFQIFLKNGTHLVVYSTRSALIDVNESTPDYKGCPIIGYNPNEGILEINHTLNMQNQIKWLDEHQEVVAQLSAHNEEITTQLYNQIYPKAFEDAKAALKSSGLVRYDR